MSDRPDGDDGALDYGDVDRFVVAAIGEPGSRLFVLQMRSGPRLATVKVEKQQVSALARALGSLLEGAARPGHPSEDVDLETPADPDWQVGSIGLGYDGDDDRVHLLLEELVADDQPPGTRIRLKLTREQAAGTAIRATVLVEAGRPPCPLCSLPIDPDGHACPKLNGHRSLAR